MKKNKKKKTQSNLNTLVTAIEILFLLILILGYILEAVVYTTKSVMYLIDRENYTSYSELFYDSTFEGETSEENFEYLYNVTTNYDRDLIQNGNALDSEISTLAWVALLKRIMWLVIIILLCELVRTFVKDNGGYYKKAKLDQVLKIKQYLIIACVITIISNAIIALVTPFEETLLLSIVIAIMLYFLVTLIEILLKDKIKKES